MHSESISYTGPAAWWRAEPQKRGSMQAGRWAIKLAPESPLAEDG